MDRMRILVISDSHGRNDDVAGVVDQVGHIDMLIHCGDVERGEDYIRSLVDCPVYMVGGNSDYNLDLPRQLELTIGNYRVFVIHGHMRTTMILLCLDTPTFPLSRLRTI